MSDDSRTNSDVGRTAKKAGDGAKVVDAGRKTAGLSERAEVCMENGAVQQRFISLYTNGECEMEQEGWRAGPFRLLCTVLGHDACQFRERGLNTQTITRTITRTVLLACKCTPERFDIASPVRTLLLRLTISEV